ncbi:HlyD family secretion protein (plasmid) [Sinorhizobium sojae CCBAU 05684]|uniref:Membrane fusion protein (MFP) family protein n=1 Tax=Sinorhizobium sojae CCBAU 05684 TaxID=716928 RepID=A0A249PJL0_9HYPH|nr:HlyD family type I secretion periplasmic adaptor subunit [Sinorhizobium sojae]ASY65927.1 HlyD family secretion protein [Sinorhizobium sojae CCBAU 05684]
MNTLDKQQEIAGAARIGENPLTPIIAEFQSDAVELEERVPPKIARLTIYVVMILIATAIVWASLSSIDEVVVAPGKLVTTEPTIILQPLETSIVRSVDVAIGEVVRAGQTLVKLDATFSQSDFDQQRAKLAAFDPQIKRLEAELDGQDYPEIAGQSPEALLQVRLFGQRRAFYLAQLRNFEQQIAGQLAAIGAGKRQEAILLDRRESLTRIENARETLYKNERSGSLINFLSSRDARLDVDASLSQLRGKSEEAEHALARFKADRQAFIEDFRRAATEQLVELLGKRETVREELKKMELRREMVALTAPADAVVLDLGQPTVGSIVREAEPMVTLIPLDVPLEAEVAVNTRDIGRVAVDDEVRIKVDAYPFQKYGTASGAIRTISRDTFTPTQQDVSAGQPVAAYFKARVSLGDSQLRAPPGTVRLLPGMTLTAEVKVGRRTVISYFLYPLLRGLDDAIREP